MPYSLKLSNGDSLVDIPDGKVDFATTSLNLVGKNVSGYGFYQNTNFVHLLENFAKNTSPDSPLKGQLWYDSTVNALKVYDGESFKMVGDNFVRSPVYQNEVERDSSIKTPQKGMIVLVENVNGQSKFMGYLGNSEGWVSLN
jgi:hypothetical protein